MGVEDLAKHVGHVVVAKMQGADAGMDRLKAVAGELTGVTVNWASEYGLLFRGGERVALLAGDTVTINSKTYTLLQALLSPPERLSDARCNNARYIPLGGAYRASVACGGYMLR